MNRSRLWSVGLCALALVPLALAFKVRPVDAQEGAAAPGSGAAPVQADLARGEELFDLCAYCHGASGHGNPDLKAPPIAGMPEWFLLGQLASFRAGLRGLHPADEAALRMRPMALTLDLPGDVESVAAYVASMEPPAAPQNRRDDGDATRGQTLFTTCIACHGPQAGGNEALKAPPLVKLGDWYIVEQLTKFRAGIRGGSPKDMNGMLMRPMALSLPDDQAVLDVAAYISSLAKSSGSGE